MKTTNNMKTPLTILLALAIVLPIAAQEQKPAVAQKESKTKIEAFEAKTGAVIIRGFSTIGSVRGRYSTSASVESREFIDASSAKKEYGIFITVMKGESDDTSYIDYDEIESLLKGIDYISKIESSVTKLDKFQADYKTRGDFTVSTYNDSSGKIQAAVKSGGYAGTLAYLSLDELAQFKSLIQQAKAKIDSIRQ